MNKTTQSYGIVHPEKIYLHEEGLVKEEMNKTTQPYGIVHPDKIYLHEEGLRWTFVEGEHECSECSKNLKWKKEAQQGFRTLLNCNTCGLTKISKERVRKFIRTSPIEGNDSSKIFNETYSNKEIRVRIKKNQSFIQFIHRCKHFTRAFAFFIISFLDGPVRYFLVVDLGDDPIVKDTHAEIEHPKEKKENMREDEGFEIVKSRKPKKKAYNSINLEKLSLLPGTIVAYYGVLDALARWRTEDDINLIALRIGENIYISHGGRKQSRDNQKKASSTSEKTYDLVTSTLGEVSLCLIVEIDERMDDGHPRELKEYARSKNKGEKIP
ncbi:hypothetical protein PRIPAC_92318 [Pristionchus pacificus]|uniref:Uncharacterized protein n=1 Tax=Pristionchus pacificus TaxID=54126 RepID=A0A2A6BQM4_PRIPA|nr:hypothetical protein PRIPAC_92318 [Pristionchus pacificus]|eukprot:PDM68220.1 hypothetical protein PRIPAC_46264 [Pristionchus pacificus]